MPKPDSKRWKNKSSVELWLLGKKPKCHCWYFYFHIWFIFILIVFYITLNLLPSATENQHWCSNSHLPGDGMRSWGMEICKKHGNKRDWKKKNGDVSTPGKSKSLSLDLSQKIPWNPPEMFGMFPFRFLALCSRKQRETQPLKQQQQKEFLNNRRWRLRGFTSEVLK